MRVSKTEHTNLDRQESTGGNTGLAKVAVQCSAGTFVVNQSLNTETWESYPKQMKDISS